MDRSNLYASLIRDFFGRKYQQHSYSSNKCQVPSTHIKFKIFRTVCVPGNYMNKQLHLLLVTKQHREIQIEAGL